MKLRNILLILMLLLCACSKEDVKENVEVSPSATTVVEKVDEEVLLKEAEESLQSLRSEMGENVVALGSLGSFHGYYSQIEEYFETSGLYDVFPFLRLIDADHFIQIAEGTELYVIVPRSEHDYVKINVAEVDGTNVNYFETAYESKTGEPVLLVCNYDNLYSNSTVQIESFTFVPQHSENGDIDTKDGIYKLTSVDSDLTIVKEGLFICESDNITLLFLGNKVHVVVNDNGNKKVYDGYYEISEYNNGISQYGNPIYRLVLEGDEELDGSYEFAYYGVSINITLLDGNGFIAKDNTLYFAYKAYYAE